MSLFSIVMPTRNRARLLRQSLQSARWQTFDDYEIVVSDNNSVDETEQVVRECGDARVRYVRTGRDLSMRDSWEFAITQARGEFVTVLPDDDAVSPGLLAKAAGVLRTRDTDLVQWTGATYFDSSWLDPAQRNTLLVPTFTRRVVELDSRETLRGLFALRGDRFPTPANSACRAAILRKVFDAKGHLFYGYCPDHSGSCVMLSQVPRYLFLDEVLSIGGATQQSIGMTGRHSRGEIFMRAAREHEQGMEKVDVPLTLETPGNYYGRTLLLLKQAMPAEFADYEVGWAEYFALIDQELSNYEHAGDNVLEERAELESVLAAQPEVLRQAVVQLIRDEGRLRITQAPVVDCASAGLGNILDCARYVESLRVSLRGVTKGLVLSLFRGRRGLRVARALGRIGERCGLGERGPRWRT